MATALVFIVFERSMAISVSVVLTQLILAVCVAISLIVVRTGGYRLVSRGQAMAIEMAKPEAPS